MSQPNAEAKPTAATDRIRAILLLSAIALTLVLIVVLNAGHLHLLEGVQQVKDSESGEIEGFQDAIEQVKGPATVTVASLGGLGVAGGACLVAVGSPKGLKVVGASAGALAAVLLGNGLIK